MQASRVVQATTALESGRGGRSSRRWGGRHAVISAQRIAANAPIAIRQARKATDAASSLTLKDGYDFEIACYQKVIDTEDRHEGVASFNEKRAPNFAGK